MATNWQPAVIIRFTGPRFETFGNPDRQGAEFDVASELAALKALILGVAAALFRSKRGGRARLPKSFAEEALIRFREMPSERWIHPDKPGSSRPAGGLITVLERGRDGGGQLAIPLAGAECDDDIERAIDLVVQAVAAAERGAPIPEAFPKDALLLFGAWGRGLADDERCELHRPGSPLSPHSMATASSPAGAQLTLGALLDQSSPVRSASYSQAVRAALVRAALGEEVDLAVEVGHVPSIGRKSFELWGDLEAGNGVIVPLAEEHAALVQEASREYGRVLVRGLGVFDEEGKLSRFVEVDAIEPVDSPPSWSSESTLWEGLAPLSKCRFEEPRWADKLEAPLDLNAYIYGIGR